MSYDGGELCRLLRDGHTPGRYYCLSCHGPTVATTFDNVTIATTSANHIPIGNLDCNGSGCHTTANVNPGGFKLGSANINSPTLNTSLDTRLSRAAVACLPDVP